MEVITWDDSGAGCGTNPRPTSPPPRRAQKAAAGAEGAPAASDCLRIDGEIVESAWFDDETAPRDFRAQLDAHPGDLTVWINSPGGDVFAASAIYTALKEHGGITIKIDGLAASAASLIAMAGDRILMAPTAMMMIHEPWTIAMGSELDMLKAQAQLREVREGMLSAYQQRTGRDRQDILDMLAAETWMSAQSALDNRFCDGILYQNEEIDDRPAALVHCAAIARAFAPRMERAEAAERAAIVQRAQNIKKELKKR